MLVAENSDDLWIKTGAESGFTPDHFESMSNLSVDLGC